MAKKQTYGNESITSLKGADRVRLRPAARAEGMALTLGSDMKKHSFCSFSLKERVFQGA